MATDDPVLEWELHHIREAIASDWDALASGSLARDQRQSVREHLSMNIAALRELRARKRATDHVERVRKVLQTDVHKPREQPMQTPVGQPDNATRQR